ncbi:MAG: hypothetical protein ACRDL5_09620, partial [Solirubrobacteraceae bacterium]
ASLLTGRAPSFSALVLFGRLYHGTPVSTAAPATVSGPLLRIDFHSQGGSLYVRDYPSSVNPNADPYWPGFEVVPEPPPNLAGESPRAARQMLASWRARRAAQLANRSAVQSRNGGPCDPGVTG